MYTEGGGEKPITSNLSILRRLTYISYIHFSIYFVYWSCEALGGRIVYNVYVSPRFLTWLGSRGERVLEFLHKM